MKKLLIPALLFSGWIAMLQSDLPIGGNFLPALGRLLNPFQGIWQSVVPDGRSLEIKGKTKAPVRILFDERDVPHIYAENLEDALFAQGYLHASNRLFSMDLSTRSAAGRVSELIGARTIAYDRKQREKGFEWSAIQKTKSWESHPENKALIDAYVNGINTYVQSLDYKDWPVEYKILSHAPVEWTTTHSALMLTNMAISLCLGEDDLEYSQAHEKLSPEDFNFLFPEHNVLESPIIPSEKKWDFLPQYQKANVSPSPATNQNPIGVDDKSDRKLNGSNSWAVSGERASNGFPLLANDPHLGLTLPNIWYEMEIHTPEMTVHGVSLPGLPFIIIGFNENIAWGSTNSGQDVLDWYKITWKDSSRQEYLLDGVYKKATLRPEEIKIRGAKSLIDTIRHTIWGPVSHLDEHKDMAMKWIGHQKASTNDMAYLQRINKASDLAAYRDAVSAFQYPAQNKIFASTQGDIAISVAGVMPLRVAGQGETVTEGNTGKLDWQGYIPFDHAPYIINPSRGYVSSANQTPAAPDYPYPLLGKMYFEDYRGRVVNMVLDSAEKVNVEDMMALQQNNFDLHAAEILPKLIQAVIVSGCSKKDNSNILQMLEKWNYMYHRDSISPVFFTLWYRTFESLTWDELKAEHIMLPEAWRLIEIATDFPQHKYFDIISTTDKKETFADVACISFDSMIIAYQNLPADKKLNWGNYKHSKIPHLARLPQFGIDFIHASGGKHIVNAMSESNGPSWRMIVELSTPPKAWVNYPGGQSGNPASPHYKDMVEGFFEGKYYEVSLKPEANWTSTHEITIQPQ